MTAIACGHPDGTAVPVGRLDRIVMITGAALIAWSRRRIARRVIGHEERSRQLAILRERSAFEQQVLKHWYRGER